MKHRRQHKTNDNDDQSGDGDVIIVSAIARGDKEYWSLGGAGRWINRGRYSLWIF
ncbi:hypothetical protein SLEP1_g28762 [Rubroshorea leprosula]|uniref:Uncharacterized protein n=1 Tax=Rubroshorea leprosula TaxID=152421 RepID=A0AAV5K0D6_9ROSI|nr:hypothetical protein SLEP1_g28762 [Rubroshorea leprosula]